MPGTSNVGRNIREVHKGKTYARTKRKFGKKKADQQAIAIGFSQARKARKKKRRNKGENEQ